MIKRILPVLLAVTVLLTACGPQGTPTMSAAEVEGTAVAAAWTMVAMTQEAIPTNTPIPPTETPSPTPLPTFTPLAEPTLELIIPTATTASSSGGNCLGPINMSQAGPTSRVRIENETGGTFTISLNLVESAFGQCGAMSYNLAKNEKLIVNLPRGSWFAYAWITIGSTNSTAACSFVLRPADTDLIRLKVEKGSCRDVGA
ncbi:MAG: hypothetical protein QY332_09410 [Anaerolineales bacterium]|nr:MAG: hypothetical protein QY332_09410 [Anaerolineales bacterium]